MAGPDELLLTPTGTNPDANAPSLPLYAAGFVITLCGILAANAALTNPDYAWVSSTFLVAGLGFLFSYGCRRLHIAPKLLDYGFAGLVLVLLACILTHQPFLLQLLPVGADRPDLRLLSQLVWGGAVWAWTLRSDNRVAFTTVPAMAALGMAAEIDVNTPVLVCFGVFILTIIFLLIHQNFLQNRVRAAKADPSAPMRLLLAQLVQAGLCGLVVLLVGMLVIVPAQVIFAHLSLAQAIRHLAATQPDPNNPNTVQRFSDDDNLSIGTGDAWSASAEVVMRATPSDGQPHYYRGRTYDVYTGDGWQSSLENDQQTISADPNPMPEGRAAYTLPSPLTPGDASTAGRTSLTTVFEVRGLTGQFYYPDTPKKIIFSSSAEPDTAHAQAGRDGRLGLGSGGPVRFPYQVVSLTPPDITQFSTAARLRSAGTEYPDTVRKLYLAQGSGAQPEDLGFYRQCVSEAFQSLPPNQQDPFDKAQALRLWVSKRCVYTLTLPPLPDGTDHVHAFLGDTKKGYCDMFASSLAVLCRTAGIPARMATGFAPGDPDGASFNLRAEDKHAWTEVYFPGSGWAAFDPTVGTVTDGTVPSAASGPKTSWLSRFHFQLNGDWILIYPLVGMILAIAAYVAKTELYDPWRRSRRPKTAEAAAVVRPRAVPQTAGPYDRLCRSLARLGLPRRVSETPTEYAARVLPELPLLEREWGVSLPSTLVSSLTLAYTEVLYADPSGPPPPAQPWNTHVAAFDAAARRIVRGRFWQKLFRQKPSVRTTQ